MKELIPFEKTKEIDAVEKLVCDKIRDAKKYPLSEEHMRLMLNMILLELSDGEMDKEISDLVKTQPMNKIITARFASLGYTIDDRTNVFLSYIVESPAMAVLYVYYLAYWASFADKNEITFHDFCEHIFPDGYPSEEDMHDIWNNQKIDRNGASMVPGTDNLVDYETASQSIKNIHKT